MGTDQTHGFRCVGLSGPDDGDSYQQAYLELRQRMGAKVCAKSVATRAGWRWKDQLRKQKKYCHGTVAFEAIPDNHPSVEDRLTRSELAEQLLESIKRLRDYRHRQVIFGLLDGLTIDDLARRLKCTDRTVRTLRSKAFRELRSHAHLKRAFVDHTS